jgi:hypothetical protein
MRRATEFWFFKYERIHIYSDPNPLENFKFFIEQDYAKKSVYIGSRRSVLAGCRQDSLSSPDTVKTVSPRRVPSRQSALEGCRQDSQPSQVAAWRACGRQSPWFPHREALSRWWLGRGEGKGINEGRKSIFIKFDLAMYIRTLNLSKLYDFIRPYAWFSSSIYVSSMFSYSPVLIYFPIALY